MNTYTINDLYLIHNEPIEQIKDTQNIRMCLNYDEPVRVRFDKEYLLDENVFLTKESAEKALKKIKKDHSNVQLKTKIKKVVFNNPATIVFWEDGTKTIVKTRPLKKNQKLNINSNKNNNVECFDKEKGLAMAIVKKVMGNKGSYYETFKKWCD